MKRLVHAVLLLLLRLVRTLAILPVTPASQGTARRPRVLLIRSGHLGDLVLTTPALQALKTHAPEASVTLIVASSEAEVIAHHPAIDYLITCRLPSSRDRSPKNFHSLLLLLRLARQLRREQYDLAVNLRAQFWWGSMLLFLAGIPQRIGYAVEPSTAVLTSAIPRPHHEHIAVASLRLISVALKCLGHDSLEEPYTPQRYPLCVEPTAQDKQWVSQRLSKEGIDDATQVIVIHPGSGTSLKQWRPEAWAQCATMMTQKSSLPQSLRVVLTGSTVERSLLETIAREMAVQPILVISPTIGQFAALLRRAHLVLGVDSGPLHLAVSQCTPTVQLFAPTDPRVYGPWGPKESHRVVVSRFRCASCKETPCGRLDVSSNELNNHPCVKRISEREVMSVVEQLLPEWNTFPTRRKRDLPVV